MTEKINLHTHCTFCDGKNSAREMVESAIAKGFTSLGFSSHCTYPVDPEFYRTPDDFWHIPAAKISEYQAEINKLKAEYSDRIQIFSGFEADFFEIPGAGSAHPDFSAYSSLNPDYLIGSVHFVNSNKGFYTVDHSADNVKENLEKIYNNDFQTAVCEYFEAEREMLRKCSFSILGHADLIRKRNGILKFFNEDEAWYKEQVKLTVEEIAKNGAVVELNTGAIARGIMDDVYPAEYMLNLLYSKGVPVCVNSDTHDINTIDCAFDKAYHIARKTGYKELVYPVKAKEIIVKL